MRRHAGSGLAALAIALWVSSSPGAASAEAPQPIPALRARVTDLTGTLSSSDQAALERKLEAFERRKGAQIAVLIVATTQPETIEQYALRVAEAWQLGRAASDDGALLLVAKDDRAVRIEVGYGLEGVLPDARANRIIDEAIVPRFRAGDFAAGVNDGVDRMLALIDGEELPPPKPGWAVDSKRVRGIETLLPFGLFAIPIAGGVLRAIFGSLLGTLLVGGAMFAIGWLLTRSILIALVLAMFGSVLAAVVGRGSRRRFRRGGHGGLGGLPGGWGGLGGGGFRGGGFGGGGFSGGGGGFGGGGASGRW